MGDFNGHHTLWRCEDVINRGQQLEDLILKNDLILLNDKSHTYFHSASGTFTSIDLTLCSPSLFLDFSWKVGPDPCGSDHFPILLKNDGPPSLERVQRWKLAKANWDQFQHLCSTRLHQSAIADADDPMYLFTSILKDIAEETLSYKLLTNVQCGFRSRRSMIDHLVRFETFCREAFIHNQHLVSVFFDLEKAYNTTWKYGIMKDLHDFASTKTFQ